MSTDGISRRHALTGAATVGLGLPLLAACGGGDGSSSASDAGAGAAATPSAGPLTTTADVEVGGGAVFPDQKVVVTQPIAGDYHGFSAVCPHQGCLVASVAGGTINCTCHGSKFSIVDGSVESGPAATGLAEVAITVEGDAISVS